MKSIVKKLLALVSAAAISMSVVCTVAAEPMTAAPQDVPAAEQIAADTTDVPLTRQELRSLFMNAYNSVAELTDEDLETTQNFFLDTCDADILNTCDLAPATASNTDDAFAQEKTMSRQRFFAAAVQLLETLGYTSIDEVEMDLSNCSDANELADYATHPTKVLLYIGAIEQSDSLSPTVPITTQDAVAILDQVASFFTEWQEDAISAKRYLGEEVVDYALNYIGCRYVRGGQGPKKFDCSGFVYYVYKNFGYSLKPGARNQWSILGGTIKKADLLPGDLLFFSKNGRSSGIFHVGIYIGDGDFVHAANSRKGVIVSSMSEAWYANRYLGAKRAIN